MFKIQNVKLHALKGWLPGEIVSVYIVPLDPTLKGEVCGAHSSQKSRFGSWDLVI
jgi:hypothetical protein